MTRRSLDFESSASAIPPLRQVLMPYQFAANPIARQGVLRDLRATDAKLSAAGLNRRRMFRYPLLSIEPLQLILEPAHQSFRGKLLDESSMAGLPLPQDGPGQQGGLDLLRDFPAGVRVCRKVLRAYPARVDWMPAACRSP
jgi:hypothetical protein